jgi:bacterioferritin (cytochrome b1)
MSEIDGETLSGEAFDARLQAEMRELFDQLGENETLVSESQGRVDVVTLLKLALQSEMEASEIAALWMPSTPELEAKQVLAHQVGDEMKHYDLIARRLGELGEDLAGFDPVADGDSPLYRRPLRSTVERIAAGPFAGEAIAEVRNAQFIAFCRSVGDEATARLYEETIQPEEVHHHEIAAAFLAHHCVTPALQETAAAAARTTLAIADELKTLAKKRSGLINVPVS